MHDDALDARHDFFHAPMWHFPEGHNRPGVLRPECRHWHMFSRLPDLSHSGQEFAPVDGYNFWQFFKDICKMYEGVLKAPGESTWTYFQQPPPLEMNYWHCQYMITHAQQKVAQQFGCRGAFPQQGQTKVDWERRPELQPRQVLAIGSSSICSLPPEGNTFNHHWRRSGHLLSFPRLLLLLVQHSGRASIATAESWFRSRETISQGKTARGSYPAKGSKGPGKGKGKHNNKGWVNKARPAKGKGHGKGKGKRKG